MAGLRFDITHRNDSLYSLHEPDVPDAEFVFFHGIGFEACKEMHVRAWMTSSGECWPVRWLQEEPDFPRARILAVNYDSSLRKTSSTGVFTMEVLTETLATNLILLGNIGQSGRPVVLIGHDLGGLVIKELCVYIENQTSLDNGRERREGPAGVRESNRKFQLFLRNVRGIFYFATPHQGLELNDDENQLDGELVPSLRIFNARTAQLNDKFEKLRSSRQWKTAGVGPLIVDPKSSVRCSEASVRRDTNHFMMVQQSMESINKPDSRLSSSFQQFVSTTREFVRTQLKEYSDNQFEDVMRQTVGLEKPVGELLSMFQEAKGLTSAVVLHGMGGIGKSTLGNAFFLRLSSSFDPDCRCSVDREAISNREGNILALQQSILQGLGWSCSHSANRQKNRRMLKDCYRSTTRPLLFFIDGIEDEDELEDIFPDKIDEILPQRSYIIVASRNLGTYSRLRTMKLGNVFVYNVKELDEPSAQNLFYKYAFGSTLHGNHRLDDKIWKDARNVLEACRGLPLALKAVGAALGSEDQSFHSSDWTCALTRLKKCLPIDGTTKDTLMKSLRFSYSELDDNTKQAFLDIVFCFNGSPWNELRVMYGDKLNILKRKALITQESHVEFGRSLTMPTVKVHALLVALGEKEGKASGSHITLDVEEDMNLQSIDFDAKQDGGIVLVLRGRVPDRLSVDIRTLFYLLRSREERASLPVYRRKRFARSLRILILRDVLVRPHFATDDLPENLECFVCLNSNVPFPRGDLTNMKNLIHVDIATTVDEDNAYKFPAGLRKLRLKIPYIQDFSFAEARKQSTSRSAAAAEKRLEEFGLMSGNNLHVHIQISQFQSLRKLVLKDITGLNNDLPAELFQMGSLESLSIQYCKLISSLPDFHNMKNLEYLHLALPHLNELSDTVKDLENLLSLTLEDCFMLDRLPPGVGTPLTSKLALIAINRCRKLKALPSGFVQVKTLTDSRKLELQVPTNLSTSEWQFYTRDQSGGNYNLIQKAVAETQMPPLISQVTRLTPSVYELVPESNPHVEVVFFHGLPRWDSDPAQAWWRTWKVKNSEECWPMTLLPELLREDGIQLRARILSVSYAGMSDGAVADSIDADLIAENLTQELILGKGDLGQKDRVPVVLVGHDLGGILIKQFVMHVEQSEGEVPDEVFRNKLGKFLENLKLLFYYDVPNSGSPAIEKMVSKIDANNANQMLCSMKVLSQYSARINYSFDNYRHFERARFSTCAVHAAHLTNEGGFHNTLVCPEPSSRHGADSFYEAAANHYEVCQAEGKFTRTVSILADQMRKMIKEAEEPLYPTPLESGARIQEMAHRNESTETLVKTDETKPTLNLEGQTTAPQISYRSSSTKKSSARGGFLHKSIPIILFLFLAASMEVHHLYILDSKVTKQEILERQVLGLTQTYLQ